MTVARTLVFSALCATVACAGLYSSEDGATDPRPQAQDAEAERVEEAGAGPTVEIAAADRVHPHWVVLDVDAVYWAEEGRAGDAGREDGHVVRLARSDGAKPAVLASGQASLVDLVQDSRSLYWIRGNGCGTSIGVVDKTGTGARELSLGCYGGRALRADATNLYRLGAFGQIERRPKQDGAWVELSANRPSRTGFGLGGLFLYFGDSTDRAVHQMDTTDNQSRLFAADQNAPVAIEVDGSAVYWITNPGGTVARLSADSAGQPAEILASRQPNLTALAVTATHVWFTAAGDGTLKRVRKSGGEPEVVVSGLKVPCGVAADERDVFVTDCEAGTITRVRL